MSDDEIIERFRSELATALMPLGTKGRADWLRRASAVVFGERKPEGEPFKNPGEFARGGKSTHFPAMENYERLIRGEITLDEYANTPTEPVVTGWDANGSPTEGE